MFSRGSKRALALGVVLAAAVAMSGCSSTASTETSKQYSEADIQAALKKPTTITYWQWTPGIERQAQLFHKKYPAITVNVENVGVGPTMYQKLRTAIKAGSGAPDLAGIEFPYLNSFILDGSVQDLTPYGGQKLKSVYPDWAWNLVSRGKAVYATPENAGPMVYYYRTDVFEQAGISAPPRTWDEFTADAAKLRTVDKYISTFPPNEPSWFLALLQQAGAEPFTYDGSKTIGIDFDSAEVNKVVALWQGLLDKNLVDTQSDFTDGWFQALAKGDIASWPSGSWAPVFMQSGATAATKGLWGAAPMPAWPGSDQSATWGGQGCAVIKGSKNPLVAYAFARYLDTDPESTHILAFDQAQFPATTAIANDPKWQNQTSAFFGGAKLNQLALESSSKIKGTFSSPPIIDYVYSSYSETVGAAIASRGNLKAAVDKWASEISTYATQQGFTVKK